MPFHREMLPRPASNHAMRRAFAWPNARRGAKHAAADASINLRRLFIRPAKHMQKRDPPKRVKEEGKDEQPLPNIRMPFLGLYVNENHAHYSILA